MTENQNATTGQADKANQSAGQFNFTEVFWQKTAMLFGFYWLFRWLWPSILPESLQTANFQMQMIACGAGGLVFTILAAVVTAGRAQPKQDQK